MKAISSFFIFLGSVALASCSGSGNSATSSKVSESDFATFSGQNAVAASAVIDSLALEADFLSPNQAVSVLLGLNEIVKSEQSGRKSKKRLEYMRKYIDTYDILSDRGADFVEAFEEVKNSHNIDFAAICKSYREILSDEADGSAVEGDDSGITEVKVEQVKQDSTKTETKSEVSSDQE